MLMENGSPLWQVKAATGPSIFSLYQSKPGGALVLKGRGSDFDGMDEEYNKIERDGFVVTDDFGEVNLAKIVEDHLSGAPYISKDTAVVGVKKYSVLTIDFNSGKLIDVLDPYAYKSALAEISTTNPKNVQLLSVKRTDYELLSFSQYPRTLLWNMTFSRIEASFVDQEREFEMTVAHIRHKSFIKFLVGLARLNHIGGNSMSFVDAAISGQNSMALSGKTDESSMYLVSTEDRSQNSGSPYNISNKYNVSRYIKLQYIPIACVLLMVVLSYTGSITVTRQKFTEEFKVSNEKNPITPKKKKARKLREQKTSGNTKAVNGLSSIERNADETGRIIGKLFISNTEIAKGSNGTVVMEGIYDGRPVAVKRLVQAHHDVAYKEIQHLIASDQHPNIVRWYGVEHDSDFVYISLERCTCSLGDLIKMCSDSSCHSEATQGKIMNSTKPYSAQSNITLGINKYVELWNAYGYPSPQLLKLMRDIVSGLVHLHDLGIIHRDLKPQNILIIGEKSLCAKLSDMGISKRLLEDKSSIGCHPTGYGSSGWQAPEQLLHGRQTRAVDLFSLGCVLFYCITGGKHPYGDHLERDINIVKDRVDLFMVEHLPEAVDLFSLLLNPNPELRPSALYVLHHPLFWDSELRLSFFRDVSDRVELEDRENGSDLLRALEKVGPVALGGNWDEKMETKFINNIGRYRRYKFDSTRDLLRVMRNKLNHYRELPKEIQEILGPVPQGFDNYFANRFPKLLIEVYKVIYRYCRKEESFCTHVGLKFSENNQSMERSINSRQISFKKRRTRDVVAFDDALEDTASSPVNSPKVSDLKRQQVYVNPRKKDGNINSSQGTTSVHCSDFQNDKDLNGLGSSFVRENEYTQLKKRGLCLVPLSMLVNYIG
ncbi:Serine/threonine-protein kinase/endoribonuclease IRE1 [Thalictrum thalictroides]|uniref:non-specific serine/threonine protein kinase n=1 Tax=Thalictrum thalictroides TaxID=46969 RepID=A0A7J6VAV0_THATH|nr:Serine/threonine-protein kinase/endoribonuclease IRE1 [Thalictrum thalictroides]